MVISAVLLWIFFHDHSESLKLHNKISLRDPGLSDPGIDSLKRRRVKDKLAHEVFTQRDSDLDRSPPSVDEPTTENEGYVGDSRCLNTHFTG